MSTARRWTGLTCGAVLAALAAAAGAATGDAAVERDSVLRWRAQRLAALTSDGGWLTLAGLFWLKPGDNSFGSARGNDLVLENAALAAHAGTFTVTGDTVRFRCEPGAGVLLAGAPCGEVALQSDAGGEPTVLASGALRFFVIARAGQLGVRVRDLDSPRRREFRGLEYFPVSTRWVLEARFVPYPPGKRIPIVNILGMEERQPSPGALVFRHDGREWRLDTVLEQPGDRQLFVLLADRTSGHETYGGGRFLYVPLPEHGRVTVDFNRAYNPPCAFNDFATCPLPPPQNRLALRIEAGELAYAGAPRHAPAP